MDQLDSLRSGAFADFNDNAAIQDSIQNFKQARFFSDAGERHSCSLMYEDNFGSRRLRSPDARDNELERIFHFSMTGVNEEAALSIQHSAMNLRSELIFYGSDGEGS